MRGILICFFSLSFAGTVVAKPVFNGNFPTNQIRELWQICSITYQYKVPQMAEPLRWLICDCYVDTIREDLSPEKVVELNYEEAKELSARLINECNTKLGKKQEIQT
tara:strand:- start:510 stop:830 length:321 start_codon:yes stop_codon:yes gene_type:complete